MIVYYKKNKSPACYDSDSLITKGKISSDEKIQLPFKSNGNYLYSSHGSICYRSEGNCLKTDMQRIHSTHIRSTEIQDSYAPVPSGTEGTIYFIDDAGQIHMQWDNGRSFALISNVDKFSVVAQPPKY